MNNRVVSQYNKYLKVTAGNEAAAAILTLAVVLAENGSDTNAVTGTGENDCHSLTVEQAAEHLGISSSKVYKMCSAGERCCFKVGRSVRVSRDALDAFEREATEAARPWQSPAKTARRPR